MEQNRITVSDIDIPFSRMVMIILKIMLASIPAILLFYVILIPIFLLLGLGLGGFAALLSAPFTVP